MTVYPRGGYINMSAISLKLDNWVVARLSEPFPLEEVKWLPAFGFATSGPTKVLAYVDARTVVNRLNEVVGANNWSDSYAESTVSGTEVREVTDFSSLQDSELAKGYGGKVKGAKNEWQKKFEYNNISYGGVRCTINILGVEKSDVGVPSFAEQLKGAYSDSLKRAAVKFGVGEYFYRLGTLEAMFNNGKFSEPPDMPEWALPIDRPSPDGVIQELIAKVRATELSNEARYRSESVISEVSAMGRYNPNSPIIVKRAVYEELTRMLAQNG
jgi:hypothetical protein